MLLGVLGPPVTQGREGSPHPRLLGLNFTEKSSDTENFPSRVPRTVHQRRPGQLAGRWSLPTHSFVCRGMFTGCHVCQALLGAPEGCRSLSGALKVGQASERQRGREGMALTVGKEGLVAVVVVVVGT